MGKTVSAKVFHLGNPVDGSNSKLQELCQKGILYEIYLRNLRRV